MKQRCAGGLGFVCFRAGGSAARWWGLVRFPGTAGGLVGERVVWRVLDASRLKARDWGRRVWFGGVGVGRLWRTRVQEGSLEWLAWQRLGWASGVLCGRPAAGAPVGRVGWRRGPVGAGCCPVPLLLPFLWARWEALVELVLMLLRVPSGPVGGLVRPWVRFPPPVGERGVLEVVGVGVGTLLVCSGGSAVREV